MPSSAQGDKFADKPGLGGEKPMKTFAVALAVLALLATSAQAQGKLRHSDDSKPEQKKPQVDDKAYKAALERIPESKEKYDPWGVARPADAKKSR